jgi:WD40 repeat protein
MYFSEDGSLIASASKDGTVKIWDATDCSCLFTLSGSIARQITRFHHIRRVLYSCSSRVSSWCSEYPKLRSTQNDGRPRI